MFQNKEPNAFLDLSRKKKKEKIRKVKLSNFYFLSGGYFKLYFLA